MQKKTPEITLENQICFPLYACTKEIIRQYSGLLAEYDLTYTQYIAMIAIWEQNDISVTDLGKKLYLDSGTLTPLLKKLEAKGFVLRARSAADERKVLVSATEKGLALRQQVAPIPFLINEKIGIASNDLQELRQLVNRLKDQVINACKEK